MVVLVLTGAEQLEGTTHTRDCRVGDLSANGHNEQDPGFGVAERLPHLVDLEMLVLDTLPIGSHPIHSHRPLPFAQESCCGWRIWEKDKGHHASGNAARSEYQEHIHPPW